MKACSVCGSTIVFGGKTDQELRFCSSGCEAEGQVWIAARQIPSDMLDVAVAQVHAGDCSRCGGPGPVDVHTSHWVWSIVFMTSYGSSSVVSCQSCGTKRKMLHFVTSALFGWWGFPWGLLRTPVALMKNFFGLFSAAPPSATPELYETVKLDLARNLVNAPEKPALESAGLGAS